MAATPEIKAPKSAIPTPDEVLKKRLTALPKSVGSLILTVSALFSWIALPVNFLTKISSLESVARFWTSCVQALGGLRPLLNVLASAIWPVVEVWRSWTAPLKAFVLSMLPRGFPPDVVELGLAVSLCVPALIRYGFSHRTIASRDRNVQIYADWLAQEEQKSLEVSGSAEKNQEEQKLGQIAYDLREIQRYRGMDSGRFDYLYGTISAWWQLRNKRSAGHLPLLAGNVFAAIAKYKLAVRQRSMSIALLVFAGVLSLVAVVLVWLDTHAIHF